MCLNYLINKNAKHEEDALPFLMVYLGIFPEDFRELTILTNAIKYADISNWVDEPKCTIDATKKEIFIVKATFYYKRKLLNVFKDEKIIRQLRENEEYEVSWLKNKIKYLY